MRNAISESSTKRPRYLLMCLLCIVSLSLTGFVFGWLMMMKFAKSIYLSRLRQPVILLTCFLACMYEVGCVIWLWGWMCDLIFLEQAVRQNVISLENRLSKLVLRFTAIHFENVDLKMDICNNKDQNSVLTSKCEVLEKQNRSLSKELQKAKGELQKAKGMNPEHSTCGREPQNQDTKRQHSSEKSRRALVSTNTPSGLGGNTASFHIASDTESVEVTPLCGARVERIDVLGMSTLRLRQSQRSGNSLLPSDSPSTKRRRSTQEKTSLGRV